MSSHSSLAQFTRFWATFQPQRTDDLKPGVAHYIGKRFLWEAGWIIEDEYPYAGDWHCNLQPDENGERPVPAGTFVWAPSSDLVDLEIVHD